MVQAVIFDLDGVLIDSAPVVDVVRRDVFAMYGVDISSIPDPHNQGHSGSSIKNILAAIKHHTGISIDEEACSEEFTRRASKGFVDSGVTVDPGLLEFLSDLRKHDITCAIATSSRAASLKAKIDVLDIRDRFSTMVSADDVSAHKPAPDLYQEAIRRLELRPSDCVVIEDSTAGITAGVGAGCRVIGFTKYSTHKDTLPSTILTINSWSELSADSLKRI